MSFTFYSSKRIVANLQTSPGPGSPTTPWIFVKTDV